MSDLQRRWAKAKLNAAMPVFNELDEEGTGAGDESDSGTTTRSLSCSATSETLDAVPSFPDDDSSSASSSSVSSTGTVIPSPARALFARPLGVPSARTLDPIPWTTYFERDLLLPSSSRTISHHTYLTSPVSKGPLFVTHHGAGSSGLSFAVLSSEIRKRLPTAGILSPDCRGHGSTVAPEDPLDLSLDTLSEDLYQVVMLTKEAMKWKELPPVILVGHSLGGAVVTDLAKKGMLGNALLGYAVLDVVEGSAMDALTSMQTYLSTRPVRFTGLREGIDWHVRSRTLRSSVAARTSVPALLVHEEGERERPWRWRTDLARTQPFWEGWFVGLSKKFLEAKGGKMLLLAGTDRLDTELTIGQMQGKYALQVFPEAGHFIHEDLPEKTAIALVDFYRRNDRSALVLPPKVSELLAQGKKV